MTGGMTSDCDAHLARVSSLAHQARVREHVALVHALARPYILFRRTIDVVLV